jgi:hypothetical protein
MYSSWPPKSDMYPNVEFFSFSFYFILFFIFLDHIKNYVKHEYRLVSKKDIHTFELSKLKLE